MNAVNVSAGVEFSYDGTNDKFYIRQNTPGIDLVISETGTNGFLTAAKIPVGTYAMPVSTTEVIPGAGTVDLTKSFADNGIPITSAVFLINGYGSSASSTDTVQYVMGIINTMGVTISYDSSTDKFSIISTYQPPSATYPYVQISEIGDFFTALKIPTSTYPTKTMYTTTPGSTAPVSYTTPSVSSTTLAQNLMKKIDNAIADVSSALSYIGSVVNRLTYQEKSLNTSKINTDAARSRIEDADMASEQLQATKLQILQQTAITMLAQANTSPQTILSLFK